MKKTLTAALALTFIFAAINAYACGDKTNAGKAEAITAKAEMTSNSASSTLDSRAMKADAGSCESAAKAMTAEAHKVEGAMSCPYMKSADAKMQKAESKAADCPVTPGCCDQKGVKSSTASQKADVMQDDKKAANPVLIMSAPAGSTINQ
ncbi:MAG: hypothetical protein A2W25_08170 [candidate division Zixibacteria bacterium RBG_16_53_22]|nr:MAG: hypothetical protein A2W25_08170 [candidate division Zixibacteria bacterium RBG_16_53_22]